MACYNSLYTQNTQTQSVFVPTEANCEVLLEVKKGFRGFPLEMLIMEWAYSKLQRINTPGIRERFSLYLYPFRKPFTFSKRLAYIIMLFMGKARQWWLEWYHVGSSQRPFNPSWAMATSISPTKRQWIEHLLANPPTNWIRPQFLPLIMFPLGISLLPHCLPQTLHTSPLYWN